MPEIIKLPMGVTSLRDEGVRNTGLRDSEILKLHDKGLPNQYNTFNSPYRGLESYNKGEIDAGKVYELYAMEPIHLAKSRLLANWDQKHDLNNETRSILFSVLLHKICVDLNIKDRAFEITEGNNSQQKTQIIELINQNKNLPHGDRRKILFPDENVNNMIFWYELVLIRAHLIYWENIVGAENLQGNKTEGNRYRGLGRTLRTKLLATRLQTQFEALKLKSKGAI